MRAPLLVLALLAPLAAPLSATAQGEGFLQDATGDAALVVEVAGAPAAQPAAQAAAFLDLVALDLAETDDSLGFTMSFASFAGSFVTSSSNVLFTWDGRDFALFLGFSRDPAVGERAFASLHEINDDGFRERIALLTATADPEKATISAAFPKVYLMDEKGRTPGRGDTLEDVHAVSQSLNANMLVVRSRVTDLMPDDGAGVPYVLQLGDYATGNLRLSSPESVRVSNGGSTTFVFLANLANPSENDAEYDLAVADLPEGWNASVQSPVTVPGGEDRTVAVLASVPFAHDHGGFTSFNLTVQGKADPGTQGRMRFGVLHTPIPQPAGHHSELYLHTTPRISNPINDAFNVIEPYAEPSMSTASDHAEDNAFATVNFYDGGPGWEIPLSPGLRMGLDFDLERAGAVHGTIQNGPVGEAKVQARLVLTYMEDEMLTLAEAEPVAVSFQPNQPASFDLVLTPTGDADYVPYDPDQNLVLYVGLVDAMDFSLGRQTQPKLMVEDFKVSLPLNEYHDRLTGLTEAASILDLEAEGPVEKAGRPGTIVTYRFDLVNDGPEEESVEVDLAGADSHVASLVPSGVLTLASKERRALTVGVSIPPNAKEGEELEVLVFAHGVDDPGKTAIARTKTRVTLGSEAVDDESAVLIAARDAENDTPGPGLLLATLALAGAALLARRRS